MVADPETRENLLFVSIRKCAQICKHGIVPSCHQHCCARELRSARLLRLNYMLMSTTHPQKNDRRMANMKARLVGSTTLVQRTACDAVDLCFN